MLSGKTFSNTVGPMITGALLMALLWAVVQLGPVAARRWFDF
jgi:hypothetical protein